MELAVTWPELEYSETSTIRPDRWMTFVESHRWEDPDRVQRIFSLATDVVMAASRPSKHGGCVGEVVALDMRLEIVGQSGDRGDRGERRCRA
ncbi:hypothetical protein EKO23_15675 [Nocardioides guangzhouensis]|uniref:Uncharacterized protein n=1 Tax=Nocardioides guangzhouensis TaxID=2497878 RepID=A0A4V1XYU4_9ACTN|nr:hypothetical protein [Nocardioides guangzhouensis]RYP84459.1 hypothetical protein EKO23_15675 [Nocardioides guangzhouensis]